MIVFLLFLSLFSAGISLYGQAAAVYDVVNHQQQIENAREILLAHETTRQWLSVILEQQKLNATAVVDRQDKEYLKLEELRKELETRLGDPSTLKTNMEKLAPGQLYGAKNASVLRMEGVAGTGKNCDAEILYGDDKKFGAAEAVVENAYYNYESIIDNSASDKAALIQKREALNKILPQLKNQAQLAKFQAALGVVESKLRTIDDLERGAALKILAAKARNDEQRELVKKMDESVKAEAMAAATTEMLKDTETNFKNVLNQYK